MNLKERVQELFDRFQVELAVEESTEMAKAKLESGQEIETDADGFAAGASVFVTNDEGERIALPDGNYTMEDGSSFQVKDGVIAEEEETPAEDSPAPPEEEMSREQAVETLQEALRPMVESMITEAMAPLIEKMSEQEKTMAEKMSEAAAQPVSRVKVAPQVPPVDLKTLNLQDRVKAIQTQFLSSHG